MQRTKLKVMLGMSGGVDSSVAAHLLLAAGHEVVGATMRLWVDEEDPEAGGCCSLAAVEDARLVAAHFGIPHYVLNYKDDFHRQVVDYFVREYQAGRTPNPCIACNSMVRFGPFLAQARAVGCDAIAMGHYARTAQTEDGGWRLLRGVDRSKDQSYMLYRLGQDELAHTLFPLGEMTKAEVRRLAGELDLITADKPDSQEICFIPGNDYRQFLLAGGHVTPRPGDIVSLHGNVLGRHNGAFNYTIGQRKGLGLSAPEPLYVVDVDVLRNTVTVGYREDLYHDTVSVSDLHLFEFPLERRLTAKVRYSQDDHPCRVISLDQESAVVRFDPPVRAPTPGQSLVLYDGGTVIGGGTITNWGQAIL